MIVQVGDGKFVDYFALLFIAVGLLGMVLGIVGMIVGRKAKNGFKGLVIALSIFTIALFIGALVTGIIGAKPYSYSYLECDYEAARLYGTHDCWYVYHAYRNVCAWVALGLGSGAALNGIVAFVLQLLTKNIVKEKEEKRDVKGAVVEKDQTDILFYEEFSQGAIEVRADYLVIYRNWLPFTKFKAGRVATVIFINDIQHIEYKGCGWFLGWFGFTWRHYNRPTHMPFGKWFVWRRMAFNKRMIPVYEYIRATVIKNNR